MRAALNDPEVVYRRRWLTLTVLCISLMVIVLDNTILNVALPTLAKPHLLGGLQASASQLQWVVDAYTIVFAGLLLTAGSLGDKFGRYRGLVLGLSVFGIGSLASSQATSANMLILTRALMGVGGAFIMPATLSILTNVFTDPGERVKAIGLWAGVAGLGALGPITGGFLLGHFWWGSVFLVNVPIVAAGLVAGYFLIPDSRDPSSPRLDPLGALLSIAGLGTLLWGIIDAPTRGWGAPPILAAFAVGAALLTGFVLWERHTTSPMLNIHFFRDPRFSAASMAITLTFFALFGTIFLLTQFLQVVLGFSTIKAGAVLLPQAAVMMIFAPLSSVWVQRLGNKMVVAGGLFIVAGALLSMGVLNEHTGLVAVMIVGAVLGLGMSNVMAPATDSIMGSLPRSKAGVGSAVNDTTRQTGGALGVAVLGSLLASRYTSRVTHLLGRASPYLPHVRNNVAGARAFALTSLGGQPQAQAKVLHAAYVSFVSGFHIAVVFSGVLLLVTAVGVLRWLPDRGQDDADVQARGNAPASVLVGEAG